MKNFLVLSMAVLTALNALMLFCATSARAAETRPVRAATGVCSLDIPLPQNKEELSHFDVEHALRQHFTRTGHPQASIESRQAGEDIIAAGVYFKDGELFWTVRVDAAEALIISSHNHLAPVGFGAQRSASGSHGLNREIFDTKRLRRHMLGDGQAWGNWVARIRTTCVDDYRNGAPEML